jgi:hypothetical protein
MEMEAIRPNGGFAILPSAGKSVAQVFGFLCFVTS